MAASVVVAFDREAGQVLARHHPGHPELQNIAELEAAGDANDVAQGLSESGYRVSLLPLGRDALESLAKLETAKPDLVFNLCDTLCAEGGLAPLVPAALELLGIPYAGANAAGLALSKRKQDVKRALERAGLPTPRYQVLSAAAELETFELQLAPPVMVKPTHEHASIGIAIGSVCFDVAEVRARARKLFGQLGGAVLVEEYVAGREVFVSLVGDPPRSLGLMEYPFRGLPQGFLPIQSFELKWFGAESPTLTPDARWAADVPARSPSVPFAGTLEDLEGLCQRAFSLAGGRDWGRVDVRVDAKTKVPLIIDVTPNTYLSFTSACGHAASAQGLSYAGLVDAIAQSALARSRA